MAIQSIRPGKPNQNAHMERFHRTHREEAQNQHLFACLDDAREAASWRRLDYIEEGPHDVLGGMTPVDVATDGLIHHVSEH